MDVTSFAANEEKLGRDLKSAAIRDFLELVMKDLQSSGKTPMNDRERFLVALPVIGTGGAGFLFQTGKVLESYIQCILDFVRKQEEMDVILCVYDKGTLVTAQRIRAELQVDVAFSALANTSTFGLPQGMDIFAFADELAKKLSENKLILFLGSDSNQYRGVPTTEEIVDMVAKDLGVDISTPSWERAELLDKADLLQLRCKKRNLSFGDLISQNIPTIRNSLQYLLLAGLQPPGVVSTNFDQNYEQAVALLERDIY
mmetsp:Transcript_8423/g.10418  ORF Transcript_8423/g.10418 Transcript_8423/m.10418 type:complete len:257 (-) Transcript_8423:877-1647(-)